MKYRIFSSDQIAVMSDDEVRRSIGRLNEAIRSAEEAHDVRSARDLQVEQCYFLREREIRIRRAEMHRDYLQLLISQGFPSYEA